MPFSFQSLRLRRHAEYVLVYGASRKHFSRSFSFFYRERATPEAALAQSQTPAPRFGITVPRGLGGAVLRNRIKRRVRVVSRESIGLLPLEVDVVLHPRPITATMPLPHLQQEIAEIFGKVAARVASGAVNTPLPREPRRAKGARR